MANRISEDTKRKIIGLFNANFSKKQIAEECKVSVRSVDNIIKQKTVNTPNMQQQIELLIEENKKLKNDIETLVSDLSLLKTLTINLSKQIEPIINFSEINNNLINVNNNIKKEMQQVTKNLLHIGTNSTKRLNF